MLVSTTCFWKQNVKFDMHDMRWQNIYGLRFIWKLPIVQGDRVEYWVTNPVGPGRRWWGFVAYSTTGLSIGSSSHGLLIVVLGAAAGRQFEKFFNIEYWIVGFSIRNVVTDCRMPEASAHSLSKWSDEFQFCNNLWAIKALSLCIWLDCSKSISIRQEGKWMYF